MDRQQTRTLSLPSSIGLAIAALVGGTVLALAEAPSALASSQDLSGTAMYPRPGPQVIGANEIFRIRATTLECDNANEDDLWSDGDEPWVMFATIRPGNLGGYTVDFTRTRTMEDVDAGDDRTLSVDVMNRHVEGCVGVVSQVIEHDDSNKDLVYNAARLGALASFTTAMLDGAGCAGLAQATADGLHSGAVGATDLPAVDDDEVIGAAQYFVAGYRTFDDLAVNGASTVRRNFRGSGANYTVNFEIRRTQ